MKIQGQAGKKGKLRRGLHTFFKIFIIFILNKHKVRAHIR